MLAAKVVMEQGVHVEGINFYTGFCVEGHTHAIRAKDQAKPKRNNALWVAEQLGMKLHIIDIVEQYKSIVINPKHGYGANLNPCLDCKIFMVSQATQWMEQNGFDFIITGEVIGQRPMSQRKNTMPIIAKQSAAEDRLLRPLCAQNLPETLPEREGWVDRSTLLGITGRGRHQQIALAAKYGFADYAQPAGGCCFLTHKEYSVKLQDLWDSRGSRQYELDDIMLLKVGRHIRPKPYFKLIVAREEGENHFLSGYRKQFDHLHCQSHAGPLVLVDGTLTPQDYALAAQIVGRFSQGKHAEQVEVALTRRNGEVVSLNVKPFAPEQVERDWYI